MLLLDSPYLGLQYAGLFFGVLCISIPIAAALRATNLSLEKLTGRHVLLWYSKRLGQGLDAAEKGNADRFRPTLVEKTSYDLEKRAILHKVSPDHLQSAIPPFTY